MMVVTMPLAWRPDQLVLLILNAVLLAVALFVPSEPRRTAWISASSVAAMPIVTFLLLRASASRELPTGAVVTQAILWATFTVVLATLISSVTFHLRRSIARARRLGQYTLLEKIGEGGMGVVWRAEHEMLRRPTAIKLLPPASAGEQNLKRFEREAQLTARETSPHTVSVYDYGRTPEGAFYYVMEYLDGLTSRASFARRVPPARPGRAHPPAGVRGARRGALHRPRPQRHQARKHPAVGGRGIPDFAKVVDFGLVKDMTGSADARLTREDVVPGPRNTSPPKRSATAPRPTPGATSTPSAPSPITS